MQVLVATDGSKYGKWALEWIARLPLAEAPAVKVLHIVDLGALRAPFMVQPVVAGTERYLKAEVAKFLTQAKRTKEEAAAMLKSLRLKGRVVTARGPVAATIVKEAKGAVQLVAVGSRGLDALDRFMLGSVSTHVIHHVSRSVLVVREAPRTIRRIVLAIDGSSASKRAVQFFLRAMKPSTDRSGEELIVTVTHAMPFLNYPELRQAGSAMVEECSAKLRGAGYRVEEVPTIGNPADEILKVADTHEADLIVTGAKGLGAVGRFLLGSVSTRVVQHAGCSVLVVR
ncbi:MAG TPA: universal stress protein [Nitrospira sp.]|nr:universal stress protein [Nitrospira sp.]